MPRAASARAKASPRPAEAPTTSAQGPYFSRKRLICPPAPAVAPRTQTAALGASAGNSKARRMPLQAGQAQHEDDSHRRIHDGRARCRRRSSPAAEEDEGCQCEFFHGGKEHGRSADLRVVRGVDEQGSHQGGEQCPVASQEESQRVIGLRTERYLCEEELRGEDLGQGESRVEADDQENGRQVGTHHLPFTGGEGVSCARGETRMPTSCATTTAM